MKIKIGDLVKITAGKDQGREGKVIKVFPRSNKVLVEGINMFKKHTKAQGDKKPGGIIDIQKPLPLSSVAVICPQCKQQTRIGYIQSDKDKIRICKKCRKEIKTTKKSKK